MDGEDAWLPERHMTELGAAFAVNLGYPTILNLLASGWRSERDPLTLRAGTLLSGRADFN